jgi:hypothetical protein
LMCDWLVPGCSGGSVEDSTEGYDKKRGLHKNFGKVLPAGEKPLNQTTPRTDVRTLEHLFDGCQHCSQNFVGMKKTQLTKALHAPRAAKPGTQSRWATELRSDLRVLGKDHRLSVHRRPDRPLRRRSALRGGRGQP